jgi:hypothetical protein
MRKRYAAIAVAVVCTLSGAGLVAPHAGTRPASRERVVRGVEQRVLENHIPRCTTCWPVAPGR